MNINKFTQKSVEAVNGCEKIGLEYGNQQIEQEHLLLSLLNVDDSLIEKLLQKMGVDTAALRNDVTAMIAGLPKVSGAGQMYFSNDANKVLTGAEDEARAMGDDYVSVEHLFLRMIKDASSGIKRLFSKYGITRDSFLKALSENYVSSMVVYDSHRRDHRCGSAHSALREALKLSKFDLPLLHLKSKHMLCHIDYGAPCN